MRSHNVAQFSIVAAFIALVAIGQISADVVYLKDGFPVYGKVKREMEVMVDPATGQPVPIVKASNAFLLDDRVRYVIFTPKQVENVDRDRDVREGHLAFTWPIGVPPRMKLPESALVDPASPFDARWERQCPIRSTTGNFKIKQKLTVLTPYSARVESHTYDWTVNYLTAELGPSVVLPLLREHPEVKSDPAVFDKQFKVFRFCTQAGWFSEARKELDGLRTRFPDERERISQAEAGFRQQMLQHAFEEAELAARAKNHRRAEDLLGSMPLNELPAGLQAEAGNLKTRYEGYREQLRLAKQMLAFCYGDVFGPSSPTIESALPTIFQAINYDTLDRVEPFVILARQAAQAIQEGREPKHTRSQLLALLITCWVMGPNSAEPDIATSERLWTMRNSLLQYLDTTNASDRLPIKEKIESDAQLSISEIAHAITLLPPPESKSIRADLAAAGMNFQTNIPFSTVGQFAYRVLTPPDYHPNRSYPLLLILPNSGDNLANSMAPWISEAARHGYIVAAVDWGTVKAKYEYSPIEHASALACIRDVKRHFQIDSNRVFLAGFGEGANMAFDVGLSHPDVFAGVAPINGRPRWYAGAWYWRNAQYLPFYVVCGELSGDVRSWDANIFEKWSDRGYPSLFVIYRGRINEYYPAEIPFIMNWMDRKTRASGFPELGRNPQGGAFGEEFQTFRDSDNRFYWASVEQHNEKYTLAEFMAKPPNNPVPGAIQATIRNGNQIQVYTRGLKRISLWFGRVDDSRTGVREMIDFNKPIKITVNRNVWTNKNQPLKQQLETLLEDFYTRADRQRLFTARVDFTIP